MSHEVMGGIDLDPMSSAIANKTVKAKRFLTKEQNAFDFHWGSVESPTNVWLNPTYCREEPNEKSSSLYLFNEMDEGRVSQAMLLIKSATERPWFHTECFVRMSAAVFIKGRVRFNDSEGIQTAGGGMFGSVLFYFGPNRELFAEKYRKAGTIVIRDTITRSEV